MDDNAKELMKRGDKLFSAKEPFNSLCQEIAMNFYSARADFTQKIELGNEFAAATRQRPQVEIAPKVIESAVNEALHQHGISSDSDTRKMDYDNPV